MVIVIETVHEKTGEEHDHSNIEQVHRANNNILKYLCCGIEMCPTTKREQDYNLLLAGLRHDAKYY